MAGRIATICSVLGAAAALTVTASGCSVSRMTATQTQTEVTAAPTPSVSRAGKLAEIPAVDITSGPALEDSSSAGSASDSDPDANLRVIGTKSTADTVRKIRLVNATGRDIVGIHVRTDDMTSYPDADYVPVYRMLLSFSGDSGVLHDFPFGRTEEATIHYDSEYGVTYLTYVRGDGTPETDSADLMDTKESEIQILRSQLSTPAPTQTPSPAGPSDSTPAAASDSGTVSDSETDGGSDGTSSAVILRPDADDEDEDDGGDAVDEDGTADGEDGLSEADGGDVVG